MVPMMNLRPVPRRTFHRARARERMRLVMVIVLDWESRT